MDIFESASLSGAEKQSGLLSASLVNYCIYCVVARSTVAAMKIELGKVIEALQDGTMLSNPKLEALAPLTLSNYVNHAADTVFVPTTWYQASSSLGGYPRAIYSWPMPANPA